MHHLLFLTVLGALARAGFGQTCQSGSHWSQVTCCQDGTDWSPAPHKPSGQGECCRAGTSYRESASGRKGCCPGGYEIQDSTGDCVQEWTIDSFWAANTGKWFKIGDGQWVQITHGGFWVNGQLMTYSSSGVYVQGQWITVQHGNILVNGNVVSPSRDGPDNIIGRHTVSATGGAQSSPLKPQEPAKKEPSGPSFVCNCGGGSPPSPQPQNPPPSNPQPQIPLKPDGPSPAHANGPCGCKTTPACFGKDDIGIKYGHCYNMVDVNGLHLNREVGGVYQSGGDIDGLIFRVCKNTGDCSADLGRPVSSKSSTFFLQDQLGFKDWKGPGWFGNNHPHFAINKRANAVKFTGEGMCSFGAPAICLRDGEQNRGMAAPCPMGVISDKAHISYTTNSNSCKPYRFIETSCLEDVGEED